MTQDMISGHCPCGENAFFYTPPGPAPYESSPGVHRSFCSRCGTQMAYQAARYPGEIHFYAATLTDPDHFKATGHVHTDEMRVWVHLSDGEPRK